MQVLIALGLGDVSGEFDRRKNNICRPAGRRTSNGAERTDAAVHAHSGNGGLFPSCL